MPVIWGTGGEIGGRGERAGQAVRVGEPDWKAIRDETWRGTRRFWPLLLGFGLVSTALGAVVNALVGGADSLEPGLTGYLSYLKLCLVGLVPFALISALSSAIVLNGMAGRPAPREAITRRALQAVPAVIAGSAIFTAPWLVSGLITYANVDGGTWWLARAAGLIAMAALTSTFGFIDFEAIARGLGPAAAIRASAALTRGSRTWLAWLNLGLQVFFEIARTVTEPFDEAVRQSGLAWLGLSAVSDGIFTLIWLVQLPFGIAIYLELRRLQDGEAAGLEAFD